MRNLTNAKVEQYRPIVLARAKSFSIRHELPMDELTSIGYETLCTAYADYDNGHKAGASFETYLYSKLNNAFYAHIKQERRQGHLTLIPEQDEPVQPTSVRYVAIREALAGLSAEALEVANLILHAPGEVFELTYRAPRPRRAQLKSYLRGRGWAWSKIYNAFRELRGMLEGV